jgi:uncharacterized protein Usg
MDPGSSDFLRQLEGYRLTTAEITYRRPDHLPSCNSSFGRTLDPAPAIPGPAEVPALLGG